MICSVWSKTTLITGGMGGAGDWGMMMFYAVNGKVCGEMGVQMGEDRVIYPSIGVPYFPFKKLAARSPVSCQSMP